MKARFDLLLIVAGIACTLFVASQIPGEIFFSGDGGLKALHAKQHLRQGFSVALDLEAEPWVQRLWSEGLYPFKPPFVYREQGEYVVGFPFLFPVVTAPLYGLAGFHGLYILPLACLWLLWIRFHMHCRRIGLERPYGSMGLALLILASPLTMYGAIFWEHVPAAFLAFFGLDFIAGCHGHAKGRLHPVFYGLLAGLAVWLRAEYLCLVPLFVLLALLAARSGRTWWFAGGAAASVGAFFAANVALYNHPLGAHSRQVVDGLSLPGRISSAWSFFWDMAAGFVLDCPAALILLAAVPLLLLAGKRDALTSYGRALTIIAIAFLVVVPMMVPNAGGKQLGPRYILFLAPLTALLAPITLRRSKIGHIVIAVVLIAGCYRSIYSRGVQLIRDYEGRVMPALEVITGHTSQYVVVANQWTAQELESAFVTKTFFHAATVEDSVRLAEALAERGVHTFLTILLHDDSAPERVTVPGPSPVEVIEFSSLGLHGAYYILEAAITPRLQGEAAIM
jgi:hypothetical protein